VIFDTAKQDNAWSLEHKDEAGAIWAQAMSLPADLAPAIGANNAVPTRAVSEADVAQIARIADWYVASKIIPKQLDVANGIVRLKG
jgi:sulfonate transport system substrate-binding protein